MKEVAKSEVIVGELQKVFDTDQSRTKMGRLREMFDAIEKMREGGMSLEKIRLVLGENGFVIRLPTLTQYLHRIRQERGLESVSDSVPVAESKPKPERPKGPKATKPGKDKGKGKSPAAPDLMDEKEVVATAKEELEVLTEKQTDRQKRERKSSQYVSDDETSSYLNNIIKQKD